MDRPMSPALDFRLKGIKPDLSAGQNKGNRAGSEYDQESRQPAPASKRDISNHANSHRKALQSAFSLEIIAKLQFNERSDQLPGMVAAVYRSTANPVVIYTHENLRRCTGSQ